MINSFTKIIKYLYPILLIFIILFPEQNLNVNQKNYIQIVFCIIFFLYFIIIIFIDIKNRNSFKDLFIIGIDIMNIILFVFLCYLNFKYFDRNNVDNIWTRKMIVKNLEYMLIILIPTKLILEAKSRNN